MRLLLLLLLAAPLGAQPDMMVLRGEKLVADGGTDTLRDTGMSPFNVTYTIRNAGDEELNLTGLPLLEISDLVNCTVSVLQEPGTPLPPSAQTTFRLQVSPLSATDYRFRVSIESDDPLKPEYKFRLNGHPTTPERKTGGGSSGGRCALGAGTAWPLAALALLGLRRRRARVK